LAEIIAGIGTSHVPAIGAAIDHGKTRDDYWRPLFDGYEEARRWIAEAAPDVAIIVYNDHGSAFFLDKVPTFALGTADTFQIADEGYGPRQIPVVEGAPDLAWHLVDSLVDDEFDLTICQEMEVDHGLTVPLSILYDQPQRWPLKVIPLAVNVIQHPQPTAQRCYKLGRALRRAIASWSGNERIAILGTGGMSHQLQGERAGFINQKFDREFIELLQKDPDALTRLTRTDYIRGAGSEGIELIMWLVMRGALGEGSPLVYQHYHVPASNTAAGLVIFDDR
jgi:protocatechuate 4,5-dioxygenase beta chain